MIVIPEEWICVTSSENDDFGLLQVTVTEGKIDFPLAVEAYNSPENPVVLNEEQDFTLVFESVGAIESYSEKPSSFAAESVVPLGLSPASSDDESFKPKRMNSKNIFEHRFEHGVNNPCSSPRPLPSAG